MTRPSAYEDPLAFRRALTDRLRALAATTPWSLAQLQRHIAYDRLLERLYLASDAWIVKGAVALLARGLGVRATIDIDLFRPDIRELAESDLRRAAARDIGDWFRFTLHGGRAVADGGVARRIPVVASIGPTPWMRFHVDLTGEELGMTGQPEDVPAIPRLVMPDVIQHGYRVYPLVDHVSDKVVAIMQRHGETGQVSTRFKDLVDLVAIARGATVSAGPQLYALRSETARRPIELPKRFDVPDRPLWERGYAMEAGRSLLPVARTLDEALGVVRPFLDPLLDGTAAGRWESGQRAWTGPADRTSDDSL